MVTNQLADMHRSVGRIEGKLDLLLESIADDRARTAELAARTGKVEKRQSWYDGGLALIAVILAALGVHHVKN